jgi:steroid delta-isomerase
MLRLTPRNAAMIDETAMKAGMQAYIDAFNRADAEAIAALYADDATVEDPVGSALRSGKEEIAAFYRMAVDTGAKLALAAPIRGSHGNEAAMAFDVKLNMPDGPTVIRVIDVMRFDSSGRFASMRAFWGPGDMTRVAHNP